MKFLKLLLILLILAGIGIFVKIKFFNPFDQDVSISRQSHTQDAAQNASQKRDKIVLAGPFASVSHPLILMVKSGALNDVAQEVEFRLWRNPDQLRAMLLEGSVDFVAVPTNVAANLYNKQQKIQLLNVSIWGILGMMTRDEKLKTLADFKGKEIVVPFRSDMPDIVLRELLKAQGFDPDKDFKLTYVTNPINAMQMLLFRKVDHALLAEPAISMALRKTGSYPLKAVAPTLFRSADLQEEWAQTFNTENTVPQAGIAVLGEIEANIVERFNEEYEKAIAWYKANPVEAGIKTAEVLPMLDKDAIADSIAHVKINSLRAIEVKDKLSFFFKVLSKSEPKLIGGKMPDDGFYYRFPVKDPET